MTICFGKELFIQFTLHVFRERSFFYLYVCFLLIWFESGIRDLIVRLPDNNNIFCILLFFWGFFLFFFIADNAFVLQYRKSLSVFLKGLNISVVAHVLLTFI